MKLRQVILAGVVTCSLGSLAYAQQEPGRGGTGTLGQEGAAQERERGAMPRDGMMDQERGAMPREGMPGQERGAMPREGMMGQEREPRAQMPGTQAARDPTVVRQVQQSLKEQGYEVGAVDGIWGPKTESAVRQFQQAQGLDASGQLDQQTLAALDVGARPGGEAGEPPATMPGAADREPQQPPPGQAEPEQQRQ